MSKTISIKEKNKNKVRNFVGFFLVSTIMFSLINHFLNRFIHYQFWCKKRRFCFRGNFWEKSVNNFLKFSTWLFLFYMCVCVFCNCPPLGIVSIRQRVPRVPTLQIFCFVKISRTSFFFQWYKSLSIPNVCNLIEQMLNCLYLKGRTNSRFVKPAASIIKRSSTVTFLRGN